MNINYAGDIFSPATREKLAASNFTGSSSFRMTVALQSQQAHVYGGTVDPQEVANRRQKNRAARRARAAHRRSK